MTTNIQGDVGASAHTLHKVKSLDASKIESKGVRALVEHIQKITK